MPKMSSTIHRSLHVLERVAVLGFLPVAACSYSAPEPAQEQATQQPILADVPDPPQIAAANVTASEFRRVGPAPARAAQLARNTRGAFEIDKGARLEAWQGKLVLREQEDGQAEVQLTLSASEATAVNAVQLRYDFRARDAADLVRQLGKPVPILAAKRQGAAGGIARFGGANYQATSGTLTELSYTGGKGSGRFSLTLEPLSGGAGRTIAGTFSGEVDVLCFVLPREGEAPAGGSVRSAHGTPYRLLSDLSNPFCQRFL
jgi:hypothetical protein